MHVGIAHLRRQGNVTGNPGACTTRKFTYLARAAFPTAAKWYWFHRYFWPSINHFNDIIHVLLRAYTHCFPRGIPNCASHRITEDVARKKKWEKTEASNFLNTDTRKQYLMKGTYFCRADSNIKLIRFWCFICCSVIRRDNGLLWWKIRHSNRIQPANEVSRYFDLECTKEYAHYLDIQS